MTFRKSEIENVQRVMRAIINDLSSHLTTKELGRIAGTNEYTLKQVLRVVYKTSVNRFRNVHRIEYAKEHLTGTNKTVAEIANELGYGNDLYFSNCFKKSVGMSPTMYRQQNAI